MIDTRAGGGIQVSEASRAWAVWAGAGAVVAAVAVAGLKPVTLLVGLCLQVLFVVFFVRHFSFAVTAMRTGALDLDRPLAPGGGFCPSVTVLVSCRNERAVVEGLARSLAELDYPRDKIQIILIDDGSTDGTSGLLDKICQSYPELCCLHRPDGEGGGKSGALNWGLQAATGEVVVVFDADHRPRPDVIRRLVGHFRDRRIAAVQGRCEIGNRDDSLLSRLISIASMAGYLVNEYGRQSLFQLPAYGGANCAVRADRLVAVGGWKPDSVTEDTDLTLRLILAGDRIRFEVNAVDREEGVVSLRAYWRQRYRWARGHQQVFRDYRRAVWRSRALSLAEKIETTMFMLVFHLPAASVLGLVLAGLWAFDLASFSDPLQVVMLWTLLFLGALLELGVGLLIAGTSPKDALALAFFLPLFFVAIAVCTKAWIDGFSGRGYQWVKTSRAAEYHPAVVSP